MRKRIVVFPAFFADSLDSSTGMLQVATTCNILAKKYDVTLACCNRIADQYKELVTDGVKVLRIFRQHFMPTKYIVDQTKIEDFCKKKLQCDAMLVYFAPMTTRDQTKKYLTTYVNKRLIHVRMAEVAKNWFRISIIRHAMKQAKSAAMYRVFDYWKVTNWSAFVGRPVTVYGLYEDKNFKLGDTTMHLKYFPDMDYTKFVAGDVAVPEHKQRLFTFGCTCDGQFRKNDIYNFCLTKVYDDPSSKIFVYRKYKTKDGKKYNTLLPAKKYYAAIAQSKFTFVVPSTVETEVSVLRVNESIRRKCIPLFHKANNIDKVYSASDCDFIRNNLMFDGHKYNYVNDFVKELEPRYDELLDKVYQLDFVKKGFALTEDDVLNIIEQELR